MILGTGIDIVEIERIERALEKHGERFLSRIFTAQEVAFCKARKRAGQHFAVRFAAKEAAAKALGTGLAKGVRARDIEVVNQSSGRPELRLNGVASEVARQLGVSKIHISLAHSGTFAAAVVILEG